MLPATWEISVLFNGQGGQGRSQDKLQPKLRAMDLNHE